MAKKTDAEIGQMIRNAIAAITLNNTEIVQDVKVIVIVNVKNTETNNIYTKGAKGRKFVNYNQDNEEIQIEW